MISKEEVLKIAKIARLKFEENEIDEMTEDLSAMIENVFMDETDYDEFDSINKISNAFNEDVVLDSYDRDEILKNREGGENGYFVVRRRG